MSVAPAISTQAIKNRFELEAVARTELLDVQAAMVDAVISGGGLAGVAKLAAEVAGGPVAILVPRLGSAVEPAASAAIAMPALDRWATERVRGRPTAVPRPVLTEVPVRYRGELSGLVALLRSAERARPASTDVLRCAAVAVATELATEDAREETEQRLRGSLLESLRCGDHSGAGEIVRRAARLGCDLSGGGLIACAAVTTDRARLVASTITVEHPGALAQVIEGVGEDGQSRCIRVYAALPLGPGVGSADDVVASSDRLAKRLRQHAIIACSTFHSDPGELSAAVQEAELALEVLLQSASLPPDELAGGTYKLLFRMLASHPEEVRRFYEATVAPLQAHDDRYRTDLVQTLAAYLDANCNMNATANAIFMHRHTVAYRLERIRELTGLDPTMSEHRERLGLGLKVHRITALSPQRGMLIPAGTTAGL